MFSKTFFTLSALVGSAFALCAEVERFGVFTVSPQPIVLGEVSHDQGTDPLTVFTHHYQPVTFTADYTCSISFGYTVLYTDYILNAINGSE